MECRFCKTPLTNVFIDLVNSPASNSFLTAEQLQVSWRVFPEVNNYIIDGTSNTPNKLDLTERRELEVHSPNGSFISSE